MKVVGLQRVSEGRKNTRWAGRHQQQSVRHGESEECSTCDSHVGRHCHSEQGGGHDGPEGGEHIEHNQQRPGCADEEVAWGPKNAHVSGEGRS